MTSRHATVLCNGCATGHLTRTWLISEASVDRASLALGRRFLSSRVVAPTSNLSRSFLAGQSSRRAHHATWANRHNIDQRSHVERPSRLARHVGLDTGSFVQRTANRPLSAHLVASVVRSRPGSGSRGPSTLAHQFVGAGPKSTKHLRREAGAARLPSTRRRARGSSPRHHQHWPRLSANSTI